MKFSEFEEQSANSDIRPDPLDFSYPILGLVGEAGEVASAYKKYQRDGGTLNELRDSLVEELGDVLWYLTALSRTIGVPLEQIAVRNLEKSGTTWQRVLGPAPCFDSDFPLGERLPRQFEATFQADGAHRVRLSINGEPVGAWIDDNASEDDGYRFHDALHLGFVAVLGWSPVLRGLMGRKRRSDPDADRVQDGGRAIVIEEALVAVLFAESAERGGYNHSSEVDWDVIRMIRHATKGLEVSSNSPSAWRLAIVEGFRLWKHASTSESCTALIDSDNRSIVVR